MHAQENALFIVLVATSIFVILIITFFFYNMLKNNKHYQSIRTQAYEKELKMLEEERARIAKDLHDSVAGSLSAIKMKLNVSSDEDLIAQKKNLEDSITTTIKDLKNVSYNLMPTILLNYGLDEAINNLLQKYVGIAIVYKNYTSIKLSQTKAVQLFRIVEEIIQNTIKHAKCKNLQIVLAKTDKTLRLITKDDGVGMNLSEVNIKGTGLGLQSLQSRAEYLNAKLTMHSEPNKGLEIVIDIPLNTIIS